MSTLIEESDALYDSIPTNEEIECFIDKHEETNDPELLWRLARFSAILGKTLQDSAKKKHFATKIGEFANKGLELNPESAGCIKYYSIGIIEGCAGPTERAKHIHELKEHFKKAIEIDPQDAFAHHLLGVWHFRVADMPWLLKKIISAVHSNPPSATYEEALQYFEKAEEIKPGGLFRNLMMLGKTHVCLKNYEKAKEYLQKAIDFNPQRPEHVEYYKEAQSLLKGL